MSAAAGVGTDVELHASAVERHALANVPGCIEQRNVARGAAVPRVGAANALAIEQYFDLVGDRLLQAPGVPVRA